MLQLVFEIQYKQMVFQEYTAENVKISPHDWFSKAAATYVIL